MKGRIALRAVVIGVTSFSAYSQTVTLLPVKVTAPRMGGGQFSCHGTACSSAVNQESFAAHQRFLEENARYPDEPSELDHVRVPYAAAIAVAGDLGDARSAALLQAYSNKVGAMDSDAVMSSYKSMRSTAGLK